MKRPSIPHINNRRNATKQNPIKQGHHAEVLHARDVPTARVANEHLVVLAVPQPSRNALQEEEEHGEPQHHQPRVQPIQVAGQLQEGEPDGDAHHESGEEVEVEIVVVPLHAADDASHQDDQADARGHVPVALRRARSHRLLGAAGLEGGGGGGAREGVSVG